MRSATWRLSDLATVGGYTPLIAGRPCVVETDLGRAIQFDGVRDQIIVPVDPLEGAGAFTLEAMFRPKRGALDEQRMVHLHSDRDEERLLLETRLSGDGQWYADTFIGSAGVETFLNDARRLHAVGTWHTMALVCDGSRMMQFVDGQLELTAEVAFLPRGKGRTSLGARINGIWPYRGVIHTVRFSHAALASGDLLRVGLDVD